MYFELQCKCTRHKTQKPIRRYSNGQKHCQICETIIEWDGTFCPCWKLRTREYISSEKTNLASNFTRSNIEDPDVQTSYEKAIIHEHDFCVIPGIENITRCLTCNVYFCRLCGKRLNHAQIHTDRLVWENKKGQPKNKRIVLKSPCDDNHAIQLQSE